MPVIDAVPHAMLPVNPFDLFNDTPPAISSKNGPTMMAAAEHASSKSDREEASQEKQMPTWNSPRVAAPILYRPNVAAIILNEKDEMLVAQRSGIKSAWQFPQGGVDPGETFEEALFREVREEIGVRADQLLILERKDGYRYTFPKEKLKYGIYGGQEQVYYLCRFLGKDKDIILDQKCREFDRWRWLQPTKFDMAWVPKFKKEVYQKVLKDFFDLEK